MFNSKKVVALYAFLTVLVTVHAFVFYSLYVVNGDTLMTITGKTSVLSAINSLGGVYIFGKYLPIWVVIVVELICAYTIEMLLGHPLSFKKTCKKYDIKNTNPMLFEEEIIKSTVCIMVPIMSFIAALLYYPYYMGFNIFTLFANWLKLICFNFPFAYFSQLFFIQPLIRKIFNIIYKESK